MVVSALLLVLEPVQSVALSKRNNVDVDIDFTVNYTPEDNDPKVASTIENEMYMWTEATSTCIRSFDEVVTTTSPEGIQLGRTRTPMSVQENADVCCREGGSTQNDTLLQACTCTTDILNDNLKFDDKGTCTRTYDEVKTKALSTGAQVS